MKKWDLSKKDFFMFESLNNTNNSHSFFMLLYYFILFLYYFILFLAVYMAYLLKPSTYNFILCLIVVGMILSTMALSFLYSRRLKKKFGVE